MTDEEEIKSFKSRFIAAQETVEFLNKFGRYDEAVEVARRGILHALKTGVNPAPLCDWNVTAPVQEYEWRPVPKLVVYRAYDARQKIPKWPLPRSNEGLKFPEQEPAWCSRG